MTTLAPGLSWVDLQFQGRAHAIATGVVHGGGSLALVDPGPATCLETLELELDRQGLRLREVTHLLLTHIHLDHAGASGTLVRRHPQMTVLVHERGARHMVDPSALLASAARLYGDDMDRLWGECLPVPEGNLQVLTGGEQVEAGGRRFEVAYTPGHASHHVSYYDSSSGLAFVGDTAGVCIDGGYILPPTPPPDIDLELWRQSLDRIEAWSPQTLFLTHFGPVQQPRPHLRTVMANLETAAGFVKELAAVPGTDEEKRQQFAAKLRLELRRQMTETQLASYEVAAPFDLLWLGLARYWRKRGVPEA